MHNMEHAQAEANMQVANATNVDIFGLKVEGGQFTYSSFLIQKDSSRFTVVAGAFHGKIIIIIIKGGTIRRSGICTTTIEQPVSRFVFDKTRNLIRRET